MATSTIPRQTAAGPPAAFPSASEPPAAGRPTPARHRHLGMGTQVHRVALVVAALACAILFVAALVVQPQWPVQVVTVLFWFGGVWRVAAVPLAALFVVAVGVANTVAP